MDRSGVKVIDMHHHLLNEPNYAERLVQTAKELNIDLVCVSGLGLPSDNWLGDLSPTNADVLKAMERYPDTIVGFGVIRLGVDTVNKVRELHRLGFKGLKTTRPLHDYDAVEYDEIYAAAEELQLPILFHTGLVLTTKLDPQDNVSSDRMRPVKLDRVARTFPGLTMFLAHLGMPWYEEAAQMARFHRNVYVDLSGSPMGWRNRKSPQFFDELFYWENAYEKILFGTDVHYSDMASSLRDYNRILQLNNVPEHTQAKIFGGTMSQLLGY